MYINQQKTLHSHHVHNFLRADTVFAVEMGDDNRKKISDSIITMAKRDIQGRIMVSINDTDYVYNNCHIQSYDHGICILTEQNMTVTLDLDSIVS